MQFINPPPIMSDSSFGPSSSTPETVRPSTRPTVLKGRVNSLLMALLICFNPTNAEAEPLKLEGYQQLDGAITIFHNGDNVDPYFAGKALLAGLDAGMDIRAVAYSWIAWGLQHQRQDGGFDRFCRKNGNWSACAAADADDSATAVWIELLVKLAPDAGMPPIWLESLKRAHQLLESLKDQNSRVYFISAKQPVGLLMDNVEVYAALLALSRFKEKTGDLVQAKLLAAQADALASDIVRVFWQPCSSSFRVSTQMLTQPGFYPDKVAEIFPILAQMPVPGRDHAAFFRHWLSVNRGTWFRQANIDFPWGLVAIAASQFQEYESVNCWLALAAPLRHSSHWNVLEEAAYESLYSKNPHPAACQVTDPQKKSSFSLATPENLQAVKSNQQALELLWNPVASSNRAVAYEIYRNNKFIATSRVPFYLDNAVTSSTRYSYSVTAYDDFGHISDTSQVVSLTTDAGQFATVYLETQSNRVKIHLPNQVGENDLVMEPACPHFLKKTLSLGDATQISVAFADDNGLIDDNQGKNYSLPPGLSTIGRGTVSVATNPCLDREAPGAPSNLKQAGLDRHSVNIAWTAATDNQAVASYLVLRNGAEIGETTQTQFSDTCVAPKATQQYRVRALDSSGNQSAESPPLLVTIPNE